MTTLYWIFGTGLGITGLLVYLVHSIKQRELLAFNLKAVSAQKEYQSEVISELSKPKSVVDTIDSLQSGKF